MARAKSVTIRIRGRGLEVIPAGQALVKGALTSYSAMPSVHDVQVESNEDFTQHTLILTAEGYVERDSGPRSAVGVATGKLNALLAQGADTRGTEVQAALAELREARQAAAEARRQTEATE